jgi:hypothetical protein
MKMKLAFLFSLLFASAQTFAWSYIETMRNESPYSATIQNEETKGQNGIQMNMACGLKAAGDVNQCAFTLTPGANVDRTWNFVVGNSRQGYYTNVTVNGRLTKFQNVSDRGDYVRQNDNDSIQWPQGQFNLVIKRDGSVTLERR